MVDFDRAAITCIKAALLTLVAVICLIVLSSVSLWWIVPAVIATYPLTMAYGFLYGMFLGSKYTEEELEGYDGVDEEYDSDEAEEDPSVYLQEIDSDIQFSEDIVGRFKDVEIYEYILISHPAKDGEKLKCSYSHTVDDINEFNVPTDCWFVMLMPGIVYTAPLEPENTPVE